MHTCKIGVRTAQPQPVHLAVALLQRHLARPLGRLCTCLCLLRPTACWQLSQWTPVAQTHQQAQSKPESAPLYQKILTGAKQVSNRALACGNGAEFSVARARSGFLQHKATLLSPGPTTQLLSWTRREG